MPLSGRARRRARPSKKLEPEGRHVRDRRAGCRRVPWPSEPIAIFGNVMATQNIVSAAPYEEANRS